MVSSVNCFFISFDQFFVVTVRELYKLDINYLLVLYFAHDLSFLSLMVVSETQKSEPLLWSNASFFFLYGLCYVLF